LRLEEATDRPLRPTTDTSDRERISFGSNPNCLTHQNILKSGFSKIYTIRLACGLRGKRE